MVPSISNKETISPIYNADKPIRNNLFVRIWTAVVHVFIQVATKIKAFPSHAWTSIQTLCGIGESWPQRNDREFLQKAIDSVRLTIGAKSKEALAEFNDGLECCMPDALQLAITASIRAFLLSEDDFLPSYLEGHIETVIDPEMHGNNQVHTITDYFEYKKEIEELKAIFISLDDAFKQVILDHLTSCDIDQLNLCVEGKEILKKIAEFSLKFISRNPQFDQAFKGIH